MITPTSAPSVLGLFGFSAATLIVAGNIAGWYGPGIHNGMYFAPFCLAFGGAAQFVAGMWAFKARDTLATAMHGMWGSFWIAYGILWLMIGGKALPLAPGATHYWVTFGMWFVMLGLLTMIGAWAAVYTAASLLLAESYGRTILPTLEFKKGANILLAQTVRPIEYPRGMPGARVGQ